MSGVADETSEGIVSLKNSYSKRIIECPQGPTLNPLNGHLSAAGTLFVFGSVLVSSIAIVTA